MGYRWVFRNCEEGREGGGQKKSQMWGREIF
jgi:hypothetical protein